MDESLNWFEWMNWMNWIEWMNWMIIFLWSKGLWGADRWVQLRFPDPKDFGELTSRFSFISFNSILSFNSIDSIQRIDSIRFDERIDSIQRTEPAARPNRLLIELNEPNRWTSLFDEPNRTEPANGVFAFHSDMSKWAVRRQIKTWDERLIAGSVRWIESNEYRFGSFNSMNELNWMNWMNSPTCTRDLKVHFFSKFSKNFKKQRKHI